MQIHAQLGCQVAPIDDCLDVGVGFNLSIIVYLVIYDAQREKKMLQEHLPRVIYHQVYNAFED